MSSAESNVQRQRSGTNFSETSLEKKKEYLNQWRTGGSFVDIATIHRILYEELLLCIVFGLIAMATEFFFHQFMEERRGSLWLVTIPASFFVVMLLIGQFEFNILEMLSPKPINDYSQVVIMERLHPSHYRWYRIALNLLWLSVILIMNASYSLVISEAALKADVDFTTVKRKYSTIAYNYFLFWFKSTKKFQGACTMISLYRFCSFVAAQSFVYIFGFTTPSPVKGRKSAEELRESMDNANLSPRWRSSEIDNDSQNQNVENDNGVYRGKSSGFDNSNRRKINLAN